MTKNSGGKQIYRGLGSIDIAATVRSILMVSRDKEEPWKRYMFPVKSSLHQKANQSDLNWIKKRFSLDGKMSDKYRGIAGCGKSTAKKDVAVEYLQTLLAVEDLPSTYIYEKMKEYGIAKRTVQEAKKIAEISAYKKGKIWYWHMEVGTAYE